MLKFCSKIIFACAIVINVAWATPATTDVVIDMDGVLLDHWDPSQKPGPQDDIITVTFLLEGYPRTESYRVATNAGAFIESFLLDPKMRVSIFSAGVETRNVAVLKLIRLPSGKSAFEALNGRIFSAHNLDNNKKNLTKIIPGGVISRTFLIDDNVRYVPESQEKNHILVRDPESARNRDDGLRLTRVMGIIQKIFAASEGLPLLDVAYQFQWGEDRTYKTELIESDKVRLAGEIKFNFVKSLTRELKQCRVLLGKSYE